MKRIKKYGRKAAALILSLVLIVSVIPASSAAESKNSLSDNAQTLVKDETVYALLGFDGALGNIYVVNRIETPADGVYTDYGNYKDIVNLSNDSKPVVSGDAISWHLGADSAGFYYQGKLASGEFPFLFSFDWTLNGAPVDPSAIAGKSGKVKLTLSVTSNPKADDYYINNYLCQIQIPLDLDICSDISAPGATSVTAGSTDTLAYMVLPGNSEKYTLSYTTSGFEANSISVICSYFDIAGMLGADSDKMSGGVDEITGSVSSLINGTNQLYKALNSLDGGLSSVDSGASSLSANMCALSAGLTEYVQGVSKSASGAAALSAGLSTLDNSGSDLVNGYTQLSDGIKQFIASLPATQQTAYASQLAALSSQLDAYGQSISAYTAGVSDAANGAADLSKGLGVLSNSGGVLSGSASKLASGSSSLAAGIKKSYMGAAELPPAVFSLLDGQKRLQTGIASASGQLQAMFNTQSDADTGVVSFVSSNVQPKSVQFVFATPSVTSVKKPEQQANTVEKDGFWARLLALFGL